MRDIGIKIANQIAESIQSAFIVGLSILDLGLGLHLWKQVPLSECPK
jgi:hypothetical protein